MQETIKVGLVNRFKEFRRFPRKRTQQESKSPLQSIPNKSRYPAQTCALDTIMKPPNIPSGKDETSHERHKKVIASIFIPIYASLQLAFLTMYS